MPIKFRCLHCRQFLGISRSKAGSLTDCPTCGRTIRIPDLDGRIQPLPRPELNLGDSELAGALDALARLNAPGSREKTSSPAASQDDESRGSQPAAVAVSAPDVLELEPAPRPEPVSLEPALPAERTDEPRSRVSPKAAALAQAPSESLDQLISLDPAAARPVVGHPRPSRSPAFIAVAIGSALLVFGIGFVVGRMTASASNADAVAVPEQTASVPASPDVAATSEPIPAEPTAALIPALSGRLTYTTADGDIEPDIGARIIVLPEQREGTALLPVVGFRAGAADADQTLARTSIRALGGDYAVADEEGHYTVRLGSAGSYRVLFLSRFQPRDDGAFVEPMLQETLSVYFDRPTALIGPVAYEFTEITFRGDEPVPRDHVFPRE